MSFESMILRFRDLSTDKGGTIEEHQKIIADKGSVWWGWWSKQGETVPVEAFRELSNRIQKDGGIDVFLFDTGQHQLRKAKLTEIHWSHLLQPIPSPDKALTPAYYGDTAKLAWFRFSSIDSSLLDEGTLKSWSYYPVDELFDSKRSVFDEFSNKQIYSFQELRHQDRTIWFFRAFESGDHVHEIRVYDKSATVPSHFPKQPVLSRYNRLIWLSDPHFSDDHHSFAINQTTHQDTLSEAIRKDLEQQKKDQLAGVLITGDLTWAATNQEFAHAAKFIDDVKSWATLESSRIVICPGNHDLSFSNEPWKKDAEVAAAGATARQNYAQFYESLFNLAPDTFISSGRKFLLGRAQLVEIASLNSSFLEQQSGVFQGQGYIGEAQLEHVAKSMGWHLQEEDEPQGFRIVMLHHHVAPVVHREVPIYGRSTSVVYDAAALCSWIVKHEVDLIIHGHMHQAAILKESRTNNYAADPMKWHEYAIASLGSSGVQIPHTVDHRNSYGILEFGRDAVKLIVRQIKADSSLNDGDKTVFEWKIPYKR